MAYMSWTILHSFYLPSAIKQNRLLQGKPTPHAAQPHKGAEKKRKRKKKIRVIPITWARKLVSLLWIEHSTSRFSMTEQTSVWRSPK
jgi:hypothetical protein